MSSSARPRTGTSLALSAALALLSYLPFRLVAQAGLLLCVALFVADPLPPHSRLLALLATLGIALLARLHRAWHAEQERLAAEEDADADAGGGGAAARDRGKDE